MKISAYAKYRLLEIFPGFLVWLTFILAIGLSFWQPIYVIYFIIVFDFYWLMKVVYLTVHLLFSWHKYREASKHDWWQKVQQLTDKNWSDYYHLIFYPTYKEPFEVIDRAFEFLTKSHYDLNKLIVILGGEERDQKNFREIAEKIRQKYSNKFHRLLITVHPKGVEEEMPGKGSNMNYMGRRAKELVDELGLAYEKVIVSAFDIDTCVHPQYFANLTYTFLHHPNPTQASYQPLTVYHNNVWESDPITRVVAGSTTFWLMTEFARSERLFTFSSHSMSFKALVDVGFWQKDIVTEDSRIFLQGFIYYDGDYEVVPLYIPVSMNTVYIGKLRRSLVNQYKQMRRWGWGVEHFPYMVWNFLKNKAIPRTKKIRYLWNQTEGMFSWATAPILILILGRLPLWVIGFYSPEQVVVQNAPIILQWLMTFAMVGLILMAIFGTVMLPPKPKKLPKWQYLVVFLQWILFPLTTIIFGSLPAIDAQTRLMLGGKFRLGFWVSEKK